MTPHSGCSILAGKRVWVLLESKPVPKAYSALLLLSLAGVLQAQSTNAGLSGSVRDPSGALVAAAKVAAINSGTGVQYTTVSDGSGRYYFANLSPGGYRIEVEKPGFRKLIKPEVVVHVQDALELDLEMTLGATSETVTVEAGAPLVNVESGTVSTLVDHAFVENLPLNGRSFQTLIMLAPGVVVTPTAFNDQGQFSVNGRPNQDDRATPTNQWIGRHLWVTP